MDTLMPTSEYLRSQLIAQLQPMAARQPGWHSRGDHLFSYCAFDRERLSSARLPNPVIGIVLQGVKEVWMGEAVTELPPGAVFALPGGRPLDVVNIPGPAGLYESLLIEVPRIPDAVPPLTAEERKRTGAPAFRVPLTTDLCQALIHAATAIADQASAETLKTLRLCEVLTLIRPAPAARFLFQRDLDEDVVWLLNRAPDADWTVGRMAEALGLGASTLRRRLTASGHSFRALVRDTRLQAARRALENGASSLAAAEASGYASRSHFARRYRQTFGVSPSGR
jgi:AraC-like DNA-binding protein